MAHVNINDYKASNDHASLNESLVMVKRFHSALAHRLGRNLARYRKRAILTQEQLAEALQIEVSTVSRYETGVALPSLVTLAQVAALLRVTIADLLTEEIPPLSDEDARFLALLKPLDPDEREAALEVLSTLVGVLHRHGKPPRVVASAKGDSGGCADTKPRALTLG